MRSHKTMQLNALLFVVLALVVSSVAFAGKAVKLTGTRFNMDVPAGWNPGYKDIDDKLLMIYFTNPKNGETLEGVYLRKVQDAAFSLDDFKKWRIGAEGKRYDGKGFKVVKEGELAIGDAKGNFIETSWKDGGKDYVKYTAQYLKDGGQYMIVLHGVKGKVDKKHFDSAVKSFSLAATK